MVIVHFSGGFGNQLFSYAFGYAAAKSRKDSFAVDTAIQDAPWFFRNPDIFHMNISYDKRITYPIGRSIPDRLLLNRLRFRTNIGRGTKILTEADFAGTEDIFAFLNGIQGDLYLKGNWGNESWFRPYREEICGKFTFKEPLSPAAERVRQEIAACPDSVTVHIRRGDYVNIGVAMNADYFAAAMEKMAEQVKAPVFYCFSEDTEWVREYLSGLPYEIRIPEYESSQKGIEDFRLLQAGKHQIISNSSYSWWAAYLNPNNQKNVIMPCREDTVWNREFGVEGWIKLPFTTNGKTGV